ncbi:MAG: Hsp20/alpha crystallin family protein [Proteobacteria bacterium]|nr:Hsp20/alpha crystallin family protein [Pseudomonadota bacterium]
MTTLTRWNPFKEMEDLQGRLSSLLHQSPTRWNGSKEETLTVAQWAPLVDITEDEGEYLIKAELPEVRKEAVKVTVENGILNLSGERTLEKEENGRRYHRIECSYGTFARSFVLPDDADAQKVAAEFKDGVLRVRIQKHAQALPKSIEIKVA